MLCSWHEAFRVCQTTGHQLSHGVSLVASGTDSRLSGGNRHHYRARTQETHAVPQRVAIYARVSSHEQQANLDRQAERLISYCAAKGYQLNRVVKEIASGVNDSRPKLLALLEDQTITLIVVEHQDRLTRFGFRYLETLLQGQGRRLEVVNEAGDETEDLLADLTSIIYSFCARLYGQRRAKRKTEAIVKELEAGEVTDATG